MTRLWERIRRALSAEACTGWRHVLVVSASFLALALLMTWPLIRGITRDVPADLADPLLNCWILAWGSEHLFQLLHGDLGAFFRFWDSNAFYPHPLTVAYSEHLIALVVQFAPIYALTGNIIFGYNVLFLSTFVLSGVGTYFLALDLIGDRRAAFVAGLLFAFTPYRFDQVSHLQVMSSQWMPLTLLWLRRYLATRELRYWALGVLALIAQGLSCGYFLLFFPPFVALFVLWEMGRRRLLTDLRVWVSMALAALAFVMVATPFLLPYAELRKIETTVRSPWTVRFGSADVYSYLSSTQRSPVWGELLEAIRRPEAQLFPGLSVLVLAGIAVAAAAVRRFKGTVPELGVPRWRRVSTSVAAVALALLAVALAVTLLGWSVRVPLGLVDLRVSTPLRAAVSLVVAGMALLILSQRARAFVVAAPRSLTVLCLALAGLAAWLSLGPIPAAMGQPLTMPSLYGLLYNHLPGFDGLRVPARYAMMVVFFLAILGALGALTLLKMGRMGRVWAGILTLGFLIEAPVFPLPINGSWGSGKVRATKVPTVGAGLPEVYRYVQGLPREAVILEMPFGYTCHETLYLFYSTQHWHRLVNGYSGYFPERYLERATMLKRLVRAPKEGLETLRASGATHVIVHRAAWSGHRAERVVRTLERGGLAKVAEFGDDLVFEMPRRVSADRQ